MMKRDMEGIIIREKKVHEKGRRYNRDLEDSKGLENA